MSDPALWRRVGTLRAECTATNGSPSMRTTRGRLADDRPARSFQRVTSQCDAVYSFGDGIITSTGLFRARKGDESFTFAVTGGTGAYEGARGQTTIFAPECGTTRHTIHLLAAR